MTFDSLTFARRLKAAGFSEALADVNREMLVPDLATKDDLAATKHDLEATIEHQALRLTVRFGVMLAAGLSLMTAILGALIRFH